MTTAKRIEGLTKGEGSMKGGGRRSVECLKENKELREKAATRK